RPAADCRIEEVLIPTKKIADRREEAAVADHVRERHVGVEATFGGARIRGRPPFDDGGEVVAPPRVRHAEWREELRLRDGIERLAAQALDDDAEQRVASVAVRVLRPRRKVE